MGAGRGDFWKLWSAQAFSNLGDGVRFVAFPWLASLLTRDPLFIAGIGVATQSAWIFFSLLAGSVADRFDRRRIISGTLGLQFLVTSTMAVVVFAGRESLASPSEPIAINSAGRWLVLLGVAAFVLSLVEVLRDITAQAFMPQLVDEDWIETANGRLMLAEGVTGQLVGPPFGGILIALAIWLPFGFDAATFLVSAVLIARITRTSKPTIGRSGQSSVRRELSESMRWLWSHDVLRSMTLALTVNNFLNAMAFTTFVLFIQDVIGLGALGFSLIATGGAIAGVLASLVAARVIESVGRGRLMVLIPIVSAVMLTVTGLASNGWVVWAATIPTYFLGTVWSVLSRSLRQRLTPDHMQGRVTGAHRTINFGFLPVGALAGGVLVAIAQNVVGREWALRAPFLVAAFGLLGLIPFVMRNLSEDQIQSASASG
jgi:MFS family permease